MRRALLFVFVVLILLITAAGGFGWWFVHRPLPQLDGTLHLSGLKSEVTVQRDPYGIPHIRGQSLDDVFLAQGYVMAQDRLWQMDLVRRAAAGKLSEIIGPATLEFDRTFRHLGLSEAAERDVPLLDPQERAQLESFAQGVNRYIEDRRDRLPIEFSLLRYSPEPWRASDTLLIVGYMYQTLTSSWRWDLNRLDVSQRIGKERAAFLYDESSPYDHPIVGAQSTPPPKRTATAPATNSQLAINAPFFPASVQLPAPSQDSANSSQIWAFAQNTLLEFDEQIRAAFGSNNWVVDGAHTASGKPLLANDTHLSLSVPDIWYLVQLSTPDWSAAGFTLPGAPGIIIGHNDQVAWGFTNDLADVQDLYEETFNPANPLEYRANGKWTAAQVRKETILVKGRSPEILDVVVTRHGPVMVLRGNTGYALKWTATEPGGLAHSYFKQQFAHNWQEFRESFRDAAGPGQNVVYADTSGHIGFLVPAHVPIRKCGVWPPPNSPLPPNTPCGAAPLPGDSGDYEWTGYIPFDEMPQALDPPGGIIATANSRVVGPNYPHFMTATWMAPWRTDRIFQLLGQDKKFQPRDFNTIQNDIVSELNLIVAKSLVNAAETSKPRDDRTTKLIQMLANWDGRMAADSIEATFIEQTRHAIERNLLYPVLGDSPLSYPRIDVFVEHVLRERPAIWLPQNFHNYDDLLIASADMAVAELTTSTGKMDISTWRWGHRNALFIPHALGQSGILARFLSIGPYDQSGAASCIKAMGPSYGPSMRMVADLSNWDNSFMEITTGESGQLGSEYYKDQFSAWFDGNPVPAPFSTAAVDGTTIHTLRLVPEGN